MLTITNAPICKFVEFVNECYPTDDDVEIIVVESDNDIFSGEDEDDTKLGFYFRDDTPGDEDRVIILSDSLDYNTTIEVLIHEYNHHRLYTKMVDEDGNFDATHNDMFWGVCRSMEDKFYKWLAKKLEEI